MEIVEPEVRASVEGLWGSLLGLDVRPAPGGPSPPGALTGCVLITGAWRGAVTLDCAPALARRAAAVLFAIDPGDTTDDHIFDALGELTNILGGHVKSLMPGPSDLSLPAVTSGTDCAFRAPGGAVLSRLGFTCLDDHFLVTVVHNDPAPPP